MDQWEKIEVRDYTAREKPEKHGLTTCCAQLNDSPPDEWVREFHKLWRSLQPRSAELTIDKEKIVFDLPADDERAEQEFFTRIETAVNGTNTWYEHEYLRKRHEAATAREKRETAAKESAARTQERLRGLLKTRHGAA